MIMVIIVTQCQKLLELLMSAMHVNDHLCICETIVFLHALCFLVFMKYMQNIFSVILLNTIIVTFHYCPILHVQVMKLLLT